MAFDGFPERALAFYEGLEADNSKAYWTDHREVFDGCIAAPLRELLTELGPEFGEAKIFRPYRDVRFSKDKTPYKTAAAAVVYDDGGAALYLQLSSAGLYVGGGYHQTATDQVARLRVAVADDASGAKVENVLAGLTREGWTTGGETLKRVPKAYPADHKRADLLRHKSLSAGKDLGAHEWLHEPAARHEVAEAWRELASLNAWLARHVGPTRLER